MTLSYLASSLSQTIALSFLSPCVLPLVPPYLIYLTGATIEHVANDRTA
jgi:cytochrome c biogenesis protein CcdA